MHKIAVIHYHQKYQAIILQTVNDMEKREDFISKCSEKVYI